MLCVPGNAHLPPSWGPETPWKRRVSAAPRCGVGSRLLVRPSVRSGLPDPAGRALAEGLVQSHVVAADDREFGGVANTGLTRAPFLTVASWMYLPTVPHVPFSLTHVTENVQ